ncbi:prevent-host-death protein [Micromonospora lutea]|uniref:Uncharacterized protein n=1 Tax=Micromonospora lutea TaxID=419825 RepID=A0ABQ4ITP3_9ACTN|nr:prevent-host-death protein [Micromonospora lutea]GIJ21285.1 hypothetical protein Vlu01_19090 [Micromonospora lutea]
MAEHAHREITRRELRNLSGAIMRGDSFIWRRTFVLRAEVMAAFATAPVLDAETFRRDLDSTVDQDPFSREW